MLSIKNIGNHIIQALSPQKSAETKSRAPIASLNQFNTSANAVTQAATSTTPLPNAQVLPLESDYVDVFAEKRSDELAWESGCIETFETAPEYLTKEQLFERLKAKDSDGRTDLMKALENGHTDAFKAVTEGMTKEQLFELFKIQDKNGNAGLIFALGRGHTDAFKAITEGLTEEQRSKLDTSKSGSR